MALKQKGGEAPADTKKRRRVGFASIDSGIEASECIKIFLVSSQDEVGMTSSFCIEPADLNHFFGEDGKIYGYKDLKINIWLSCISFHAYADIAFERTSEGAKGITDLKPALQSIFGESLLEKNDFLQTFSTEHHCIRNMVSDGAVIHCDFLGGYASKSPQDADNSTIEVIRMGLNNMYVGLLYSRLFPLVLLLVEGAKPADVTDPKWEIYFVVKKTYDQSGDYVIDLLGFTTAYHFYHYPDSARLRISQIIILPPYQRQGHGRRLLESVNHVAVSENIYDVTFEEPSDYLQYMRACIDTLRLISFEPIRPALNSVVSYLKEGNLSKRTGKAWSGPSPSVIEVARQKLKINKKQFLRCWEVLIYLNLDHKDRKYMENFRASLSDRLKADILDKDAEANDEKRLVEVPNDYGHDMTFVVFRSQAPGGSGGLEGDPVAQEQQLNQLVDTHMEEIAEIAEKVSSLRVL